MVDDCQCSARLCRFADNVVLSGHTHWFGALTSGVSGTGPPKSKQNYTWAIKTNYFFLSSNMEPVDRVRVLVVGDAGTGKSTLVHQLCQQVPPPRPPPRTVGFALDVAVGCSPSLAVHELPRLI